MSDKISDLSEDEIYASDSDPLEDLAKLRREENAENETEENSGDVSDVNLEEQENSDESDLEEQENVQEESENTEEEEKSEVEEEPEEEKRENKKRTFKADGKEYSFTEQEMLDMFGEVFGKAANFTQKTQRLKPYTRMISALEEQNLTEDQFNMALDLLKGDKNAIKTLAKEKDIDLNDLLFEDSDEAYTPKIYGKSDFDSQIEEIEREIGSDPEYATTVDVIDKQWDDESRAFFADNPKVIKDLHYDVKTGVYAKVAPEAMKLQILDGNSKSSLDYYLLAGQKFKESLEADNAKNKVDTLNKKAQEAEDKFGKESSEAQSRRAAKSTASVSGTKSVTDYLDDDNDEKFDSWYKKLNQSH